MTRSYSALLLDLDDTLLDTREGTHRALLDFHRTHGALMGVGADEAEALWDQGLKQDLPRYLKGELTFQEQRRGRIRAMFSNPDLTDAESDALFEIYLQHSANHYLLFGDVLGFLDGLSGLPVAIVTNGAVSHQSLKVRATGLADRIKTVIISEAVGLRKPQPEIFRLAAKELGAAAESCLMVGDNYEADCVGALGAGMGAVWMDRFGAETRPEGIRRVTGLGEMRGMLG